MVGEVIRIDADKATIQVYEETGTPALKIIHAKYSMLRYAFDELNFERVEFKTDVLNERAKQGLRKVGGIEEGVLRSHMTLWNGRRRSSVYYSVLKDEWSHLKSSIFHDITGFSFSE